ncbi:crotonase/enoyl-CoA hydratase family protein [Sphingobium limneticum]|jgi:DSF synthase|uniref:crotonase/enoyl-CoA hydratase family protein n=1 Tax=Sphingobium TaxID=165695 RepID=UPI000E754A6D|nr:MULTISPECIES: crotonase/enoyl-CoA hydratase family protein [Sphingobium]KAA9012447.1 crotonase/enoyl-CoA hydratase family protein [Sphingobium limneticum]MBU0932247.1 crotonase/enoyl-CoA hydratase family protein [Alphaproteobacteria bacterium]
MIDSGRFSSTGRELDTASQEPFSSAEDVAFDATETVASELTRQSMMFDLGQIDVQWDAPLETLWAFMAPQERPNFSMAMLRDVRSWYVESKRLFDAGQLPIKYLVAGSRFPGVFNLGGDLELFAGCIERGDLPGLIDYGHACIDVVNRTWRNGDMPVVSIALAQGDALGGGFEALLCFDIVVAERSARFGLPEMLFGLFPGMGAYSILARKLGRLMAERMILSGKVYTAEEMYDLGIVHRLVEDGEGEAAVRDYISSTRAHHSGHVGVFQAGRRVDPLDYEELKDIVENWAASAVKIDLKDMRMMRRLASAQTRLTR